MLDQGDLQALGGGVHARRQAGRTRADNGHVVGMGPGLDRDADRLGKLTVRRVGEDTSVVEDHDRQRCPHRANLLKDRLTLARAGGVEAGRECITVQHVAKLVRARRALVAHHSDQLEPPAAQPPPLVEEFGDRAMEPLVRHVDRFGEVVVDVAERRRPQDRAGGGAVTPLDEQAPPRGAGDPVRGGE
jgi:hypothetical protein